MNVINEMGAMPTRNSSQVQFEGANNISGEAMAIPRKSDGKPNLTTNAACFGCTIACGRISTIDQGHFSVENKPQYWGNSGGLEYEAAWAMGSDVAVDDIDAVTATTNPPTCSVGDSSRTPSYRGNPCARDRE